MAKIIAAVAGFHNGVFVAAGCGYEAGDETAAETVVVNQPEVDPAGLAASTDASDVAPAETEARIEPTAPAAAETVVDPATAAQPVPVAQPASGESQA